MTLKELIKALEKISKENPEIKDEKVYCQVGSEITYIDELDIRFQVNPEQFVSEFVTRSNLTEDDKSKNPKKSIVVIMINIQELQKLTQEAILRGKEEKQRKDEEKARKKVALRDIQVTAAKNILAQIPSRALIEAQAGRNFAIVMNVGYRDSNLSQNHPDNVMKPEWIIGETAKLVYEGCIDLKMKPTLEYWHDGCGIESGYNIVVHW